MRKSNITRNVPFFVTPNPNYLLDSDWIISMLNILLTSLPAQGCVSWDLINIVGVRQGHVRKWHSCCNTIVNEGMMRSLSADLSWDERACSFKRQQLPKVTSTVRFMHQRFYSQPHSWESKNEFLRRQVHVGSNWDRSTFSSSIIPFSFPAMLHLSLRLSGSVSVVAVVVQHSSSA